MTDLETAAAVGLAAAVPADCMKGVRSMVKIERNGQADSRTCDPAGVTRGSLMVASLGHIAEVRMLAQLLADRLKKQTEEHDRDKIEDIHRFHSQFVENFEKGDSWLKDHRKGCRHHLDRPEAVPDDVNLIDVLEFCADCVAAGLARSGEVKPPELPEGLLDRALRNTFRLLEENCEVEG